MPSTFVLLVLCTDDGQVVRDRGIRQLGIVAVSDLRMSQLKCTLHFRKLEPIGQLGSRVVSVLDSGAEGPGFKSQPRRCRVTVLGKRFTPIVPLFTKQRSW